MENEILMQFEGLTGSRDPERVLARLSRMPGVELVDLDPKSGKLRLIGGDIDPFFIADTIEGMGYPMISGPLL